MMRLRILVMLTAVGLAAGNLAAHDHAMNVRATGPVESCSDLQFDMDGQAAVRGEDRLTIGGNALSLRLGDGHGIPLRIAGTDRSGYELLLCKAATNGGALAAVRLAQNGSEVSVTGPSASEWRGYLVVRAPRGGEIDVEATNGPVAVSDIAGRLRAQVTNGPISLQHVAGTVEVRATNGPIAFTGSEGDVSLTTENGPVSIRLEKATWEGGELRTSAKNGPVTLKVPEGYASGIAVERGARAPFRCPTELCGPQPAFFEDDRTHVEIGSGAPRVHLAAKNGPISIKTE
ncbi:MAG TPA: hypothetical protein VGF40_05060 [Thermoanaerobaculia bacterium]